MRLLGIPNTKPPTKFEVSSSSSFGDMFDRMPKVVGVTWPRPRPVSGKIICALAWHSWSKAAYPVPNLKSLAQVVFEILRSKRIGVTSLTFQGHVTSSVTWPFVSPYVVSYWWSFGTKLLSVTVSEIFNVKCNATVDVTLLWPLNKGQGHSFWYQSISHMRLPIGSQWWLLL